MRRLEMVRSCIAARLEPVLDGQAAAKAYGHLYQVSLAAVVLAMKRGEDAELAAIAGMLHDVYAYQSGSYEDHARRGAQLAREILDELNITSPAETEKICHAVACHDSKENIDTPFDEILKDADVLSHTLNDPAKPVKDKEKARYEKLRAEFHLQ